MNQPQNTAGVAGIHQTLMILWGALVVSQLLFLMIAYIVKPELFTLERSPFETESVPMLALFAAAAIVAVGISFVVRSRSSKLSEAKQSPLILQSGLITALAACEVSSLLGLVAAFAFNYPYFYFWIALGVVAAILHYPRFGEVLATSYRSALGKYDGV